MSLAQPLSSGLCGRVENPSHRFLRKGKIHDVVNESAVSHPSSHAASETLREGGRGFRETTCFGLGVQICIVWSIVTFQPNWRSFTNGVALEWMVRRREAGMDVLRPSVTLITLYSAVLPSEHSALTAVEKLPTLHSLTGVILLYISSKKYFRYILRTGQQKPIS